MILILKFKSVEGVWRRGIAGSPRARAAEPLQGLGLSFGVSRGGCSVCPLGRKVLVSVWRMNALSILWDGSGQIPVVSVEVPHCQGWVIAGSQEQGGFAILVEMCHFLIYFTTSIYGSH